MIELTAKLSRGGQYEIQGQLILPFELRQKRWLFATLKSGEEVALKLPRGTTLRGGDLLLASNGRIVEVKAAAERLMHIECETPAELAKVAYHLGNRHVPVQVGEGFLRLSENHVLGDMVRGLRATLTIIEEPFEPETGAYKATNHDDQTAHRTGRIHSFGNRKNFRP